MLTHVTASQIAEARGVSKTAVLAQAAKQSWPYEERPHPGGAIRYFPLNALPTKIAQAVSTQYWTAQIKNSRGLPPRNPSVVSPDGDSTGGAPSAAGLFPEDLASLTKWAQGKAVRLTPKELADPAVAKKLRCARMIEECPKYMGRMAVMEALGREYGVKALQIRRWWEEVKTWRVKAKTPLVMVDEMRVELPKSNAFDVDALSWGISCHAHNLPQGKTWAYEQLQAKAQEQGWKIGDYTSFCRLLSKVPDPVWDAIKKGRIGFELQITPKIMRAWLETPVYETLCGDQNILDYLVLDETTGEILILNLYLWMDCSSRGWTGMWPAFGPYRSYTVGASLREACRLALPGEIFTDWGKCELSRYVADTRMALSRYCGVGDFTDMEARYGAMPSDEEGIRHRKPGVREPWKKPIENQMNIVKRRLLDLNLPGFRQKIDEPWANSVRSMDLKIAMKRGHLLTVPQMLEALLKVMADHNREECKLRELRGGTIVPGRVLADGLRAQSRTVLRDETLDYLFLPQFERTAARGICTVKLGGHDTREFFCPELTKLTKADRKVRLYVDPYDPEAPAKITTLSGDFIGLGEPWKTVKPGDDEALTKMIRAQKKLLKDWRNSVARIMAPYTGLGTERIGYADKPAREAGRAAQEREAIRNATQGADNKLIELFNRGKRA
jgi:hypothetical protein